jgi:hypothetical protein
MSSEKELLPEINEDKTAEFAEMQEFLQNPARKREAVQLAMQVQERLGKNWFTETRMRLKTNQNAETVHKQLQLLRMFDLVEVKPGDFSNGREAVHKLVWKITIGAEHHIRAINEHIGLHQDQINQLKNKLKKFEILAEKSNSD